MATLHISILHFLNRDHSLCSLCVHCFALSLRPWFPAVFPVLLHVASIPPIIPIVCQVPMAHQQKQWEEDSGTIHGTRMVFIFLTTECSNSSLVYFHFVWASSRKNWWGGGGDEESEKMKRQNKDQLGRAKRRTPSCVIAKLPFLIPFTISTALRHRLTIQSADFYPQVQLMQLWKSFQFSLNHTYPACASSPALNLFFRDFNRKIKSLPGPPYKVCLRKVQVI